MEDLIGNLMAVPDSIEVKLFSDDGEQLRKFAPTVIQAIEKGQAVVDINNGIVRAGDAQKLHVDLEMAALEWIAHDCRRQYLDRRTVASSSGTVPNSASYVLIAVRGVRLRIETSVRFGKPPRGRRVP